MHAGRIASCQSCVSNPNLGSCQRRGDPKGAHRNRICFSRVGGRDAFTETPRPALPINHLPLPIKEGDPCPTNGPVKTPERRRPPSASARVRCACYGRRSPIQGQNQRPPKSDWRKRVTHMLTYPKRRTVYSRPSKKASTFDRLTQETLVQAPALSEKHFILRNLLATRHKASSLASGGGRGRVENRACRVVLGIFELFH